jgi:hypothetical protein
MSMAKNQTYDKRTRVYIGVVRYMNNAEAENLNDKLQRFVSANYGLKDKNFSCIVLPHIFHSPSKKISRIFCFNKKYYLCG